jgi:hypothetical protein
MNHFQRLHRHFVRYGFHGWAIKVRGAREPLAASFCVTRSQARQIRNEEAQRMLLPLDVVKVKLKVEVVR